LKRIIIIGAGGHGREVADIVRHQSRVDNQIEPAGFVDDNPATHGQMVDGLPVFGDWSWFDGANRADIAVVCAVGSPQICRRLVHRAKELGLSFASAISPLAHISASAHLGEGVTVFPGVIVNTRAVIDSYSILNVAATVSHDTRVGPYSNVNPGAHLAGNVTIGEGCYIGMGANVIQGRSIGAWSIIGAGAVVIRDLPANTTAVGVPARAIKIREERLDEQSPGFIRK
jgi:sugar O-acyltransferase (sialic acid O-acetyltransferase NeuD family)